MSRINAKPRGRPFAPGNPGKPRGARHRVTRAVELMLDGEHEKLTRIAIDKALEGDTAALRLCLDRIAPARRDVPVSIELPPVRSAAEAAEASAAVLASVASGEVTPDEAGRIMALLASHKTMVTAGDLERRIAALEEAAR
jgi:multidrug efflux pump subunit AcrA (membrane-fusion protein)